MGDKKQKKIAMINDLSGYGRCALTAAIPVTSALKVQCCPVVTSVLSNHAGYSSCFFDDYTDRMPDYIEEWKKHGFSFDGIMTGFLASPKQVEIITDFVRHFKGDHTKFLVDPVLGDQGRMYRVCSEELCDGMRELIQYADIITPNLTEGCFLTDTPYEEKGWSKRKLADMTYKLLLMGAKSVVLTGVVKGNQVINVIHEREKEPVFHSTHYTASGHHGTGDVFSAVIAAGMVKGISLEESVRVASVFTRKCVEQSEELEIPEKEGICIEECLPYLMKQF